MAISQLGLQPALLRSDESSFRSQLVDQHHQLPGLLKIQKTMDRSTIFNGKINYSLVGGAITILKNDGVRP